MGRILGIDHGNVRVGLALSDPLKIIAKPYKTIIYNNGNDFFRQLNVIIADKCVEHIVVGFPKGMKGQTTKQTEIVIQFVQQLKEEIDLSVTLEDERLSSVSAAKALILQNVKTGHNKGRIDETAAAIVLQQYLDRSR